ncbi:MAG: F0F1 ATP synthase subunit epsilon [Planctomycetaceae bacterium]|jgi:F-type H+-transporting ATPase subunit epsilon|nr:F0F1 ATP synthase subunit epsilon [Planctomycetaceae bacterium]MBT6486057.1 F0F1 ATP synthase subunit epsilon [Planctomycetaceae bacterium]MBT6498221.1 F0F1 ATP synthase subunit epsilon [Planctomycetaceae bacterium]
MADKTLQLVLVTPETTLLDEPVQALRFPLFDGQAGILPGRAPVVGRLGYGELRVTGSDGENRSFYVDGGFVQVKGSVVSLLTNRAIPVDQIDSAEAKALLEKSRAIIAKGDSEIAAKDRDQERARRMLKLASS